MRFFRFFAAVFFLSAMIFWGRAAAAPLNAADISATSAILVEATTGRVVYEKNADERRYPASMTKMMTAIIALENVKESSIVTVSPLAAATDESWLDVSPYEQISAIDLITGMMLLSDNCAAVAIAEHVDDDVENFAAHMNKKAKEIGCVDTNFVNPNGLPDANHYSTARDMAKIAAYCMKNARFRDIVALEKAPVRFVYPAGKFVIAENSNELLGDYGGAVGIKTGWTNAAGGCLAAAAKRNGVTLIAIVMQSEDTETRFDDAKKLFDYGFANVKMRRAFPKERVERGVWIRNGIDYRAAAGPAEDVNYVLVGGETPLKYSVEYDMPRFLDAPVKKGDVVGKMILKYDGKEIGSVDMTLRDNVPQGFSFYSYFLVGLLSYFVGE